MTRSLFAFLLSVSVFGCGSPTPPANSFTNVYKTIIEPTCANEYCHYAGVIMSRGSLDLSSQVAAYWGLVDKQCESIACNAQGLRVVPWQPDASIFYLKVADTRPPCGVQMPASVQAAKTPPLTPEFSGKQLSPDQLKLIRDWISAGALDN